MRLDPDMRRHLPDPDQQLLPPFRTEDDDTGVEQRRLRLPLLVHPWAAILEKRQASVTQPPLGRAMAPRNQGTVEDVLLKGQGDADGQEQRGREAERGLVGGTPEQPGDEGAIGRIGKPAVSMGDPVGCERILSFARNGPVPHQRHYPLAVR